VRLNDEEKRQIDEPDVVLDIATAEAPAKPHTPPMASPKPGRMLAFAPFQGVIRRMSVHWERPEAFNAAVVGFIRSKAAR
jgi:hypothetical protein